VKFTKRTTSRRGSGSTQNFEGAKAYRLGPKAELYAAACTSVLEPTFYVPNAQDRLDRLRKLISANPHEFTAKLAVYAREQMHLRAIPTVLAVELARVHKGDNLVSKTVQRVCTRPDQLVELLGFYAHANPSNTKKLDGGKEKRLGKLSKQIKIGLANALKSFDEYQLAKYSRPTDIKLRDVLFLTHPKPDNDEQKMLFEKLANGTLEVPYTWETELSALGQQSFESDEAKQAAFKAKWEELIDSRKVGYMAMMRNLRNILQARVSSEHITRAAEYLSNEKAVLNSKQLPFRFYAAYAEIDEVPGFDSRTLMDALEDAVKLSAQNVSGFDEQTKVCIACDVSGSMEKHISERSKMMYYDIGLMLGMVLQSRCKRVITGIFGDEWKVKNLPKDHILENVSALRKIEGEVGYSTNGWKVLDYLNRHKIEADKIMMFTDCQLWDSTYRNDGAAMDTYWKQYSGMYPNAKLYLFDLTGHGTTPLRVDENRVFHIAGWSNAIFDVLDSLDKGASAVDAIEKIEL